MVSQPRGYIVRTRFQGRDVGFFTCATSKKDAERIFRTDHPDWPIREIVEEFGRPKYPDRPQRRKDDA